MTYHRLSAPPPSHADRSTSDSKRGDSTAIDHTKKQYLYFDPAGAIAGAHLRAVPLSVCVRWPPFLPIQISDSPVVLTCVSQLGSDAKIQQQNSAGLRFFRNTVVKIYKRAKCAVHVSPISSMSAIATIETNLDKRNFYKPAVCSFANEFQKRQNYDFNQTHLDYYSRGIHIRDPRLSILHRNACNEPSRAPPVYRDRPF